MQTSEWIRALKIAIVNEAIEEIARLYGEVPERYESLDEAKEAAALMGEAIGLLKRKREQLQREMDQTRKAIAYQKNQAAAKRSRYDHLG